MIGVVKKFKESNLSARQIKITTTGNITTNTVGSTTGYSQSGRNTIIDNGINAINVTVDAVPDVFDGNGNLKPFLATYLKKGTGNISFIQGVGRTLIPVDGTSVMDGLAGSTATITTDGTTDYLRISNA